MDILEIIKYVTGTGFLIASLTYLGKRFIDKSLDASIEKYKMILQQDIELFKHGLNKESEQLKFELNKISLEHQTKYNALYQERGQVIKDVYLQIVSIEDELLNITTRFQGQEWKDTKNNFALREKIFEFEKWFEFRRLYFNESHCSEIEKLIEQMRTINHEMYSAKLHAETNEALEIQHHFLSGEERAKPSLTWFELDNKAKREIKLLRRSLEREFAKIIGVE